jgi:alanine racemase
MSSLVWIELDRDAPDRNVRQLKRCAGGDVLFCAVVKSNAYGHGLREMLGLLPSADWLAVNSLEEGLELRGMGEVRPVLLLGHVPLDRLGEAVAADLRLTVYNRETLSAIASSVRGGKQALIHLKIETGTGRQGVLPSEAPSFAKQAASIPGVVLEGLSTHFANIEDTLNHGYAEEQLGVFRSVLDSLSKAGISPLVVHTACTAASILFPETHFRMVRSGIGVYGMWPSRETYLSAVMGGRPVPELRPVLSWKTRLVQIKDLPEGSFVGYGCSYRTTRSSRIGVLPVGYADGYDRALGNSAHVLIRGRRAPVVGRICMNLTMVDITDIESPVLEEEVTLLGSDGAEQISAETLASWAGTINYEIVTRISPLLPRLVLSGRGIGTEGA